MRDQGWELPERTLVIPYFTRPGATGEPAARPSRPKPDLLRRIAFFGRVDEKKGLKVFADGLNAVEPERLDGLELQFVGKTTATWTRERAEGLLSDETKRALRRVSFESELDQHEALALLSRPGTLAVMPSLHDNSPNAVYECLEQGIPFIASNVGGVPELIDPADQARVLFEPTAEGVEAAIRRVLEAGRVPDPVCPAFDGGVSSDRWAEVLGLQPQRRLDVEIDGDADPRVDVVVVRRGSQEALLRCVAALEEQTHANSDVIVADTRQSGLDQGSAPYVVFLEDEDTPDPGLLKTLLAAGRASGADVVTSGLRLTGDGKLHFFLGEPGGLGAVTNAYGNVGLFRRAVLEKLTDPPPTVRDPDWPLMAELVRSGASVISVPIALVERQARPGSVEDDPSGALLVVQQLELELPDPLRGAARVAAGLAANLSR
jgi:hypothetical protein